MTDTDSIRDFTADLLDALFGDPYVIMPYSPEFGRCVPDAHDHLIRRAHAKMGRSDHRKEKTIVKLFGDDQWYSLDDPTVRQPYKDIELYGLLLVFPREADRG